MRKSLFLLMTTILLFPSLASAQTPPKLGEYQLDWAILHAPVHIEPPSLVAGSSRIVVEPPRTPDCPPESVSMAWGPDGRWCFDSQGLISIDVPIFGFGVLGHWTQYPAGKAIVVTEAARGDMLQGVATFISPVKAFITYPRAGITVSGTNLWVVMWAEGTTGSANVFTLSADGKQVGVAHVGSSEGPVTMFWNMTGVAKGVHTLRVDVLDAEENTGSTTLNFVLQ